MHALRRREFEIAEKLWAEEVALCAEHNFSSLLASGIVGQGWAMVERGLGEEGISRMRHGLQALPAAQSGLERRSYLIQMAYAFRKVRWPREGLAVVAEVLKHIDETGDKIGGTDLYRVKGDMLLMQGSNNESKAEQCFREAIEIARRQSAKSGELGATMSLARLLAKQGKRDEARTMLTEIYNWFTEGFDTADLKEAKALLQGLSESGS
jgi:predicted ATPase